jgi:hypothetical protein
MGAATSQVLGSSGEVEKGVGGGKKRTGLDCHRNVINFYF